MFPRSLPLTALALFALGAGCPAATEAPPPEAPPPEAPPPEASADPASPPSPKGPVSAHGAASKPSVTEVHGLPNLSGIAYADPACDGRTPCRCRGAVAFGHNALAKIGVTEERLAEGVFCVFADVDDNGYADVAVLGAKWRPGGPPQPTLALLYDVDGLRSTATLPKRMASLGRARAKGRAVLVEPAARAKYHFALNEAGSGFELVRGGAK